MKKNYWSYYLVGVVMVVKNLSHLEVVESYYLMVVVVVVVVKNLMGELRMEEGVKMVEEMMEAVPLKMMEVVNL